MPRPLLVREFPALGLRSSSDPSVRVQGSAGFQEIASRNKFDADCKAHVYGGITAWKVQEIMRRLQSMGYTVTGSNPYEVDTHSHGVKLYGEWNGSKQELYVDIETISRWFGVPTCTQVWNAIDPEIGKVQALNDPAPQPAKPPAAPPTPPPQPSLPSTTYAGEGTGAEVFDTPGYGSGTGIEVFDTAGSGAAADAGAAVTESGPTVSTIVIGLALALAIPVAAAGFAR